MKNQPPAIPFSKLGAFLVSAHCENAALTLKFKKKQQQLTTAPKKQKTIGF